MLEKEAFELVEKELKEANNKFPLFNSPHEGYAIIKEEVDELWHEIKNDKNPKSKSNQKDEAIQVAAMAIKYLISCCKINY